MPKIYDNIESKLVDALKQGLANSQRADFCVGYFNLRGWKTLDQQIESWTGTDENCCRLLIGMQKPPQDELKEWLGLIHQNKGLDNQTAIRIKRKIVEEFRKQLCFGIPTNEDEQGLRQLAKQIQDRKVRVRLFLEYSLHAKLYILHRPDPISPMFSYLGSSNLTFAGLSHQGELNIDVLDQDSCYKLSNWFEERWNNRWCIDISDELAAIISESWAREKPIPPYHIYLKMAYHLSQEARSGITEFQIPREFNNQLFDFQVAAVKIAAHHLNKRGGVLIGDVVGLGKTLMATALAKVFEEDHHLETLIICPKNLVPMWEFYVYQYHLYGKVISSSQVENILPELRRYRLVIIDESHNLRNREGKRFKAIQEYISENNSKVILLSATPYNKTYLDLASQLRLFIPEDKNLGIRPELYIKDIGETEFIRRHQCPVNTLPAFEKSDYPDDWRELMRLYMVRRTRGFIMQNYADKDSERNRYYLTFPDGTKSYIPIRVPKTAKFKINEKDRHDQYGQMYSDTVVDTINSLTLPRYGLGNYLHATPHTPPTTDEAKTIQNLSRAGKRLMGFCRTNIFKRLESSGHSFIQSIERHALRNYIFLYAIEKDLPLPIGTQDFGILDTNQNDGDLEGKEDNPDKELHGIHLKDEKAFQDKAAEIYKLYQTKPDRFNWLKPNFFIKALKTDLESDTQSLLNTLKSIQEWDVKKDTKLQYLIELIQAKHPQEKILVFSQFADTVDYLRVELKKAGITHIEGVTGDADNPMDFAQRFSPVSNQFKDRITPDREIRVLISTDVLSEGQNLQDAHIILNYDLPWAIIRLIQRAGRVDRIGQKADTILSYSFLPASGVEKIIKLRAKVLNRLRENAEVVGTDERFFEDEKNDTQIKDLYNEKSGILDGDEDLEVDLASYAYQIWKNATKDNPELNKIIAELPEVVYSTKPHISGDSSPEGVLVYLKTGEGNDALAWVDKKGQIISEAQLTILKAAACSPNTPAIERHPQHHELVQKGVEFIIQEEKNTGGQLGRPSGARFKTYSRLQRYAAEVKDELFDTQELHKTIEEIYQYPLRQSAIDTLNRQIKSGVSDQTLAELAVTLREDGRLCIIHEKDEVLEPQIICSLGMRRQE